MNLPKRYLITAALPYANGLKHIGHLAGAYLPSDIYVRYLKAQKRDVVFVSGSDEHGAAITIQAMKEGTTPRAIVDKYHEILKSNFADLGIEFDMYHRTSDPLHHETAQEFFTYLNNNGDLEEKETEQYFDLEANTFLADRYIVGTCPVCGHNNAFGDQCEKCGSSLSPDMLINPRSTLSGNTPIKKLTKHWFLPLDRHEDFLREWIVKEHASDWKTNVLGQCKSWIDAGLQARAVTRDLDWGIKVPSPPAPEWGDLQNMLSVGKAEKGASERIVGNKETAGYVTADPLTYSLLKNFVREHRSSPTEAERVLWELLRGKKLAGNKFRSQHIIGSYIADFVCVSKKLIVEVDGLIHQLPDNNISDQEQTDWLNQFGFKVIRFTNEEVLFEPEKVLNKIADALNLLKEVPGFDDEDAGSENTPSTSLDPPSGGGGAKVLYVWFDAPIGYISATRQWAIDNNKNWKPYWYDQDTKLVHFIGKDNIVFHCIIFPVMLKLHGNILPANVPANEFMNMEGDKMSTSRGWSIEMDEYINDWIKQPNGGKAMADVLRYYLTTISPETKDSEFTWKGFQNANNSELVSIFGNFVNRAFVLMHKLCKGKVPMLHSTFINTADEKMMAEFALTAIKVEGLIEQYKFRDAQDEVIDLARKGNKYMQDKEPWILDKKMKDLTEKLTTASEEEKTNLQQEITTLQQKIDICLHVCLQLTANLSILINPFLPAIARKLCHMMKVVDKMLDWNNAGKTKLLSVGYSLREPQLLFRKIEDSEITTQLEKLKIKSKEVEENKAADQPATQQETPAITENKPAGSVADTNPVKPEIVFDDFAKIDLKVGTIVSAEKVEKADKLLKLQVDLGFETRTIVSGIALYFKPEEIVGKQVTVVVNLAPRKMRGIESNGMILMAEDKQGKLHFISSENKTDAGSQVS